MDGLAALGAGLTPADYEYQRAGVIQRVQAGRIHEPMHRSDDPPDRPEQS